MTIPLRSVSTATCATLLSGILFCLIVARFLFADGSIREGLLYISESGGKYPLLPIFAWCCSFGGISLGFIIICYTKIIETMEDPPPNLPFYVKSIRVLAYIGGAGLTVLGNVSVFDHFYIHSGAAQVFFIATLANAILILRISQHQHKNLDVYYIKYRRLIVYSLPFFIFIYLCLPYIFSNIPILVQIAIVGQYLSVGSLIVFFYSLRLEFENKVVGVLEGINDDYNKVDL
ncbi:hypothetical protein P9112_001733 [Eukaryota sp. TZLM1-RC]